MTELFHEAFAAYNLPYTILLLLVLLYWLTVFVGVLDLDFFELDVEVDAEVDIDIDTDIEVDADVDADADTEVGGGGGGHWFATTASFFNVGAVPFMIFLSFFALCMWVGSMFGNSWFREQYEWFPLVFIVPNLLISLFATKILTTPFKAFHKRLTQEGLKKKDLVGKQCTITLGVPPGRKGQAELHTNDQNFLLSVRNQGTEILEKGRKVILIEYDLEKDDFLVLPFD